MSPALHPESRRPHFFSALYFDLDLPGLLDSSSPLLVWWCLFAMWTMTFRLGVCIPTTAAPPDPPLDPLVVYILAMLQAATRHSGRKHLSANPGLAPAGRPPLAAQTRTAAPPVGGGLSWRCSSAAARYVAEVLRECSSTSTWTSTWSRSLAPADVVRQLVQGVFGGGGGGGGRKAQQNATVGRAAHGVCVRDLTGSTRTLRLRACWSLAVRPVCVCRENPSARSAS
jgi:hypothetical protein